MGSPHFLVEQTSPDLLHIARSGEWVQRCEESTTLFDSRSARNCYVPLGSNSPLGPGV